jgi:protein ImuB
LRFEPAVSFQRILCIAFPHLSSDRALRQHRWPATTPLVLVQMQHSVARVVALSPAAHRAGLRPGATLAASRAVLPALRDLPHDAAADTRALESLAVLLGRFSPIIGIADGRTLALDITGCGALYSGESCLFREAVDAAAAQGYHVRAAVASTAAAARAIANFGSEPRALLEPNCDIEALLPLPPRALLPHCADVKNLAPDPAVHKLDALGVSTIGALLRLPRAALTARVGAGILLQLDRALGLAADPIAPHRPAEPPRAKLTFAGAVDSLESIFLASAGLCRDLADELAARRLGARELRCVLERSDGPPDSFSVAFSEPRRSGQWFESVVRARLERIDLGLGVTALEISVASAEPLADREPTLFETESKPNISEDFRALLDRYEARLGPQRIGWISPLDDYRPERSFAVVRARPAAGGAQTSMIQTPTIPAAPRPLRVLRKPQLVSVEWDSGGRPVSLRFGAEISPVSRALGPEIVETGWWDAAPVARRYFLAECAGGRGYWLFRDAATGQSFVHGFFT